MRFNIKIEYFSEKCFKSIWRITIRRKVFREIIPPLEDMLNQRCIKKWRHKGLTPTTHLIEPTGSEVLPKLLMKTNLCLISCKTPGVLTIAQNGRMNLPKRSKWKSRYLIMVIDIVRTHISYIHCVLKLLPARILIHRCWALITTAP